MRTHILARSITAAALALCVVASGASAQGKGKGKEKNKKADEHVVTVPVVVQSNGTVRRVPPGLAKKPGGLPPGQAKKLYRATDGVVVLRDVFGRHGYTVVRTQPYGTSQYVYYRRGDGAIQRAIIVPGTERLSFQNVPQTLLQEILARLY